MSVPYLRPFGLTPVFSEGTRRVYTFLSVELFVPLSLVYLRPEGETLALRDPALIPPILVDLTAELPYPFELLLPMSLPENPDLLGILPYRP